MIKAMFFDLDGTLLNSEEKLTCKTIHALAKCKKQGIRLFVATARPPLLGRMLSWDDEIFALFDGGVYYNGGCTILGGQKEYESMRSESLKTLLCELKKDRDLNIALQLEDEVHAIRYPLKPHEYTLWGIYENEVLALEEADHKKTVKVFCYPLSADGKFDPEEILQLGALVKDEVQFYLISGEETLQVMRKGVSKELGIEKIRIECGFLRDEVAVFGDNDNDLEMLTAYENSVAMGNAEDQVKRAARYVTLSNDEDGVAHAIMNIFGI